jgi:hypothetical protein
MHKLIIHLLEGGGGGFRNGRENERDRFYLFSYLTPPHILYNVHEVQERGGGGVKAYPDAVTLG